MLKKKLSGIIGDLRFQIYGLLLDMYIYCPKLVMDLYENHGIRHKPGKTSCFIGED